VLASAGAEDVSGFVDWLPAQGAPPAGFFGLSREVTPLMLAMELRALGDEPRWWKPIARARWRRRFIEITNWWLTRVSVVVKE
jgi:hypothetical protein